jgi:leucyl aminopeptidase (aminopeptidase T)
MRSDYEEQERIADRFFALLSTRKPYRVSVKTESGNLVVEDRRPWFDFAGRLREGELRFLPAGEVSYAGDRADGEFIVDGAILPFPEHPDLAEKARAIGRLSRTVELDPLVLEIRKGLIVNASGNVRAREAISRLFDEDNRYRQVVEVGISFNSASRKFIHQWPAASNEVHPGVHLGLGGDPSRSNKRGPALIHIDLIAANCQVLVNGQRFLQASS